MSERDVALNIMKLVTTAHKEAAIAERVSGMATPGAYRTQNSTIHTAAANTETRKVNTAVLFLDVRTKWAVIRNIESGKSAKKATDT